MRILAPSLLVALLACHNFVGLLITFQVHPITRTSRKNIRPTHRWRETWASTLGCISAILVYAAVLISILFGAVIGLLLKGIRTRNTFAGLRLPVRYLLPLVLHPPRGPTAPVLQAFRL